MSVKTFWCEPIGQNSVELIVYDTSRPCRGQRRGCRAEVMVHARVQADERFEFTDDDPRWPTTCERCGRPFTDQAKQATGYSPLYRGHPDGEEYPIQALPPGAMWDAEWLGDQHRGPDGIALVVRLPNGMDWAVDGPASNAPEGWAREGDPRKADVEVRGSIASGTRGSPTYYHGWLREGRLVAAGDSRT